MEVPHPLDTAPRGRVAKGAVMIAATRPHTTIPSARRHFRYAALAYALGFLLHNLDHFRRGIDVLTSEVLWLGSISGAVAIAAIALALVGHRLAPAIAVAHGFTQAVGVAAVHLLLAGGVYTDSLSAAGADIWSWGAVLVEIGTAFLFGAAGTMLLRRDARPATIMQQP
jgi:hypothetical protein